MTAKHMKRNFAVKARLAGLTALVLAGAALWVHAGQADNPPKTQVILISVDTLRGDHLNSYGYARETAPYLAELIKDSVYYREAYLNGCWTIPSHVSMLTGTLPSRHGVNMGWKFLPGWTAKKPVRSIRFLAEILQSRKVHTQKFAKLSPEYGFDRGFDNKESIDPFLTNLKFKKVQDYLESSKDKDFFLFLHTWMVHSPYTNTHFLTKKTLDARTRYRIDHFRRLYAEAEDISHVFAAMLKENQLYNVEDCIALYDGGIQYVDRYIGRIISLAKRLGIYQNLMVIVTSDHGEHFSEHLPNQFYNCHGRDFTEEFIRVPLVIKYPGGRLTGSRDDPVSLIDIVPTILDRYGWEIPPYVQGRSLLRKAPGEGAVIRVAEAIHENLSEKKMIRSGSMKYIVTMNEVSGGAKVNWEKISQRRLFDLANDPGETRNLYDDPRYRKLCNDLERSLMEIIRKSASARFAADSAQVSEETLKQMKALGYL
jgi:arylsulfatase A-like enzyme